MTAEKEQKKADDRETAADNTENESEQDTLTRELEASNATIRKLEETLAVRDREIEGLKNSLSELKTASDGLNDNLTRTVAAYREIALQANPGVLAELITGNSIDEINESLKNARVLVDKVRQEIETETTQTRIPVGAPSRSAQDIAFLSPREKIQRALGGTSS